MATSIVTTTYPLKKGSPPDFGTLYSGRGLVFDGVGDYINFGSAPLVTFSGESQGDEGYPTQTRDKISGKVASKIPTKQTKGT